MPRVCSLIHVESTSRSLSHPLQLQFLQARLMAVEKVVEGGLRGPCIYGEMTNPYFVWKP